MKRFSRSAAVVMLAMALGTTACATVDPLLVPNTDVGTQYTVEQLHAAILAGLLKKGWSVESEQLGEIVASVTSGGHSATIRVRYHSSGWVIEHVESSPGLRYRQSGPSIHKRYNNWVKSLDAVIRKQLLESAGAPQPTPGTVSAAGAASALSE